MAMQTITEPTGHEPPRPTWAELWLEAELRRRERGRLVEMETTATCDACGRPILAGERAYWFPRVGRRPERLCCVECGGETREMVA